MQTNLFDLIVKYHIDNNLKNGLQSEEMIDGVMHFRENNYKVPVKVGEENGQHWYKGFVLFANGSDITEYLVSVGIIPSNNHLSFVDIKSQDDFLNFLDKLTKKDGAAVYDSVSRKGTRLKINQYSNSLEDLVVEDILPDNFLSEDSLIPFFDENGFSNIGCRTDMAVKTSRGVNIKGDYHPIDAYLIKHTMYNKTGFGPVVHISQEEIDFFFLKYSPESKHFIDSKHKIIGIYKKFRLDNRRFVQVYESEAYINEEGRLCTELPEAKIEEKIIPSYLNRIAV